jgi:CRISPR-associated protein Csd1
MILKALYDYYQRSRNLAPLGFEEKEISFIIVIDEKGKFIRVENRQIDNKSSQHFLVVKDSRTSAPKPYIFYDNVEYVLNYTKDHEPLKEEEQQNEKKVSLRIRKIANSLEKHQLFIQQCEKLSRKYPDSIEFKAVTLFYRNNGVRSVKNDSMWPVIIKETGANVSFLLQGKERIIAEAEELINEVKGDNNVEENIRSLTRCLITGERSQPVELTAATKIPGSQATAKLVSFQVNSGYDSYGKSKGFNAPISQKAEAAYTTALNKLLGTGSHNKFCIGNRTFLFWASSNDDASLNAEDSLFSFLGFSDSNNDDPNRRIDQVKKVFSSIYSGTLETNMDDKFYILGLAPNVARIAVVYWNDILLKDFARVILKHFNDMEIVDNRVKKRPYYGLYQILSAVSLQGKVSEVQPNLPETVIKSIFQGIPYPYSLFHSCIQRIRAEQNVTVTRAAIIKAYLNRLKNININIKIMIDKENTNQGYLCGRLFATLEYLQERSNGIHTIRERYMTAASSTPSAVFATLLNLSVHHSEKLEKGGQIFFEKIKSEIIDKISTEGFPSHLNLQEQGCFMVGYYQQRQAFYSSIDTKENV